MRKNRMLRMASALLMLVLLTTSVVGGTFAKYVTTANANDSARVAKWGVTFTTDTSLMFKKSYIGTDGDAATVKLIAADDKNLVAPGTTGTGFSITNSDTKPEVSYNMTIKLDSTNAKVPTVKYTPDGGNNTIYEPVKFTVSVGGTEIAKDQSISQLAALLDGSKTIYKYSVNDQKYYVITADGTLNTTGQENKPDIQITWQWAYENTPDKELYDKLDTVLGNKAAGIDATTYEGGTISDINTEVSLPWMMTATQID